MRKSSPGKRIAYIGLECNTTCVDSCMKFHTDINSLNVFPVSRILSEDLRKLIGPRSLSTAYERIKHRAGH